MWAVRRSDESWRTEPRPTVLLTSGNLIPYVEPLNGKRTMLADLFSILLETPEPLHGTRGSSLLMGVKY